MRRAALSALVALLATGASAHPAPNSRLELAIGNTGVRAEYWVPLSELAYARSADPRGGFADYLLRHVAAESPGGEPWHVSVHGVREATYADHAYLVADLSLVPPAGTSPRTFVLLDDAVTHEVRNHVVFVVARRAAGADLLGLLQYPARRLEIAAP
ncbi:MAG TPA: hypothetical protein VFZ95_01905 [Steroidobacteraceae bacterium]